MRGTADLPEQEVADVARTFHAVIGNVARVVQGKAEVTRLALACLAAGGHLLVEDVPGVGKTSIAKGIAGSLGLSWQRIQFTPDLLPSDITGVTIFEQATSDFRFRPGAVFSNILLGDEINRASPKTQSALLEAMEERHVTIDGTTHALPDPFLVVATQNPYEHEGTFPLPESQLDRFLMRISVGYPSKAAENTMLEMEAGPTITELPAVVGEHQLKAMLAVCDAVHVAEGIREYLVDLADLSRSHPAIALGMSPRATLGLYRAAKAWAASEGRDYVTTDDVRSLAFPVLGHRLVLDPGAQMRGANAHDVVDDLMRAVPQPRSRREQRTPPPPTPLVG